MERGENKSERQREQLKHTLKVRETLSDFLPTLAMTVVSAVTVVGTYKQDSMETVTAIQMENTTTSHGKAHQHCRKSKACCTTGTDKQR